MTVGEKIKKIRTFRGMTQKELGLAVGFEEKGADNRIAQYETNYRVPKRELLDKIAQALRVESQNFYTLRPGCAEDFMRTFFWLDEDSPGSIRLFQLVVPDCMVENGAQLIVERFQVDRRVVLAVLVPVADHCALPGHDLFSANLAHFPLAEISH